MPAPPADPWRPVARSLVAGAAYDALFAVALLFARHRAGALLGIEPPDDPLYLRLIGVLLLMLAAVYLVAARAPARHRGIVVVAAAGRSAGALTMGLAWRSGAPAAFAWLAAIDLAFGLWHLIALGAARRAQLTDSQAA